MGYGSLVDNFTEGVHQMSFSQLVFYSLLSCALLIPTAQAQTSPSIAETAAKILKRNQKKAELEKETVKTGQKIEDIGNLTIEDFLELNAVPDGVGVVEAELLSTQDNTFDFMSVNQAIKSLQILRGQGVELPKGLEEDIRKNPEQMSKLMNEAFSKTPQPPMTTKEYLDKVRRQAIRSAEENTGIEFKEIMLQQKRMMTPKED